MLLCSILTRPNLSLLTISPLRAFPLSFAATDVLDCSLSNRVNFSCFLLFPLSGLNDLSILDAEIFAGFITSVHSVGTLEGEPILQIKAIKFVSLKQPKRDFQTTPQEGAPVHPTVQLSKFYSSGSFYFSSGRDLTLSAQARVLRKENQTGNYWDCVDYRFLWNRYPLKDLIRLRLFDPEFVDKLHLLVPIIRGFIEIREVRLRGVNVKVALISRGSVEKAGTRFNMRGIDDQGHTANFVETEQLLFYADFCFSYVQIRGSVPVFWEQRGLQLGSHKIDLSRGPIATAPAFKRHFEQLIERYGSLHVVNLLSTRGGESALADAYSYQLNLLKHSQIKYTRFDFNSLCKNQAYENLFILLNETSDDLASFGFFMWNNATKEVINTQQGVFRTNCVDCLDRF